MNITIAMAYHEDGKGERVFGIDPDPNDANVRRLFEEAIRCGDATAIHFMCFEARRKMKLTRDVLEKMLKTLVEGGHKDAFLILVRMYQPKRGKRFGVGIFTAAAFNGRIDLLDEALRAGLHFDYTVLMVGTNRDNAQVVKWGFENGCELPPDKCLCTYAVKCIADSLWSLRQKRRTDVLDYMLESRRCKCGGKHHRPDGEWTEKKHGEYSKLQRNATVALLAVARLFGTMYEPSSDSTAL